ncbi:MAG: hypothetical protein FWG88_01390 [Oscillospiraceae bacterium]|nr:hypothetical protein [Oscillospiraceae bacterium]
MKKKMPPLFYIGIVLNSAGVVLMRVLSNWQHNWLSIPVALLGTIFIAVSVVQMRNK